MTSIWKWIPLSYASVNYHPRDPVSTEPPLRSTALESLPKRCGLASIDRTRIYLSTRHWAIRRPVQSTSAVRSSFRFVFYSDRRANGDADLQVLQWWSESFVTAIVNSTNKIPYGMRYLARETLAALREKFPDATQEEYASCLGRLIYYRSINPAIM